MKRRALEGKALRRFMVQRPRGTRDFGPSEMKRRLAFESLLEEQARRHGFSQFKHPSSNRSTCLLQSQDLVLFPNFMRSKTRENVI